MMGDTANSAAVLGVAIDWVAGRSSNGTLVLFQCVRDGSMYSQAHD
jgi:hypothetical protein